MKSLIKVLFAVCVVATLQSCSSVAVNGGEEAVLVMKPWIFGHGGVVDQPVTSGQEWVALSTDHVKFATVPITHEEHFDNMMTKDNTPIDFSAYIKTQVRKGQTPILYKDFGAGWYAQSIQATFRAMVRDKASEYKMFDLTSNRQILAQVEADLFAKIKTYCDGLKIPIDVMQVVVGAITPPAEVLEETQKTAAQNQSKLTQSARADAEDSRKRAEVNKAIADKAYRNEMGMTMAEYLAMRQLEIEKEKIEMARGKSVTIVMGTGVQPVYPVGPGR